MLYAMQCALPEKDKPAAEEIYLYDNQTNEVFDACLLYTSPSPRDTR